MSDLIDRQKTFDIFQNLAYDDWNQGVSTTWANAFAKSADIIEELPSAQPEITDEQAIEHLQSTGWMQNHDREMNDMGLKKQLADDSGSYDSLLPTAEPSFDKDKVSNLLYHIYSICSPHTSAMGVAARNFYFEELGKELFGDDIPGWMQR